MDLDKAWLYRQGSGTEVDDPAAEFPEELDNLFEKLHYNPTPRTYGVPGEHYVTIYYGPLFPKEKGAPIMVVPFVKTKNRLSRRYLLLLSKSY